MPAPRRFHDRVPTRRVRLQIEHLEARDLPALVWPGPLVPAVEAEPNDTRDAAQSLGALDASGQAGAIHAGALGTIGNAPSAAADVDWYAFTLAGPTRVSLATLNASLGSTQVSVLSLYDDTAPFVDFTHPVGPRLLAQAEAGPGGDASLERVLAAGTYFVAVSGAGNRLYHPFIADSGTEGSTGAYALLVTASDSGINPADGPVVLYTDPTLAPGSPLDRAPLVIRVSLSAALDPGSYFPFPDPMLQNVSLTYNPTGNFGDGNDVPINLLFSPPSSELLLIPEIPLGPGFYRVLLAGDSANHLLVLRDLSGNPLGMNTANPFGQDVSFTFEVNGIEGNPSVSAQANDTAPGAVDLGQVNNGLTQVTGAIGDDPFYNPMLTPFPAGSDVDLYHFRVSGSGNHALIAEVFAGRIGSPLDPALSLFRFDPDQNQLVLVATNDSTQNFTEPTAGPPIPLLTDPVVFAGLTPGVDYYLAVSSSPNYPTSGFPFPVFDPNPGFEHSGFGFTTGDYVLNLFVQPDAEAPQVVATTPKANDVLTGPPTTLTVTFNEAVNIQQLAFVAPQQGQPGPVAVFVRDASDPVHPVDHLVRLVSYDTTTHQATFMLLSALTDGAYTLHLSGPLGLTDFAGNLLVGNDPSGDYVVPFTVTGSPPRPNPLVWTSQEPNDSILQAQDLGVLFPLELQAGVRIARAPSGTPPAATDTNDFYRFRVLQNKQEYFLNLLGPSLPPGAQLELLRSDNTTVVLGPLGGGLINTGQLDAGTYTLRVGGWTLAEATAPGFAYSVDITLGASGENPTPLTSGPAPAFRIQLGNIQAPPAPTPGPNTPTPLPRLPDAPRIVPAGGPTAARIIPAIQGPRDNIPTVFSIPLGALTGLGGVPVGGVRAEGLSPLVSPRLALNGLPPADALPAPGQETSISGGGEYTKEEEEGQAPVKDGPNANRSRPPHHPTGTTEAEDRTNWQRALDALFGRFPPSWSLGLWLRWLAMPGLFATLPEEQGQEDPGESADLDPTEQSAESPFPFDAAWAPLGAFLLAHQARAHSGRRERWVRAETLVRDAAR